MPFDGTSFREPPPPRRARACVREILAGWRPIDRCPHGRGAFARAARALSRRLARRGGQAREVVAAIAQSAHASYKHRTMNRESRATYPPLNTLKRVAENLWIVDGPIIRFGTPWPKMPFPTRMTVIRLAGRDLFIHSPTPLVPEIRAEIEKAGRPRWIVGPNRLHYWWIPEWRAAFPDANVHLAPRIRERAGGRIDFDCFTLDGDRGYEWDAEISTLPVAGSYMTEVEFFHHASRTLVLTDFIENFEPHKLDSFVMHWLVRLGGVRHPDGGMPRDMRVTFAGRRLQLRAAIEKMIAWNPERIIIAHGRWYEKDGTAELRRAFRWVLD